MTKLVLWCVLGITLWLLVGFGGSLLTTPNIMPWHGLLVKPALNPPNWVFGPVWTALYVLLGASLGIVLAKGKLWESPSRGDLVAAHAWNAALNLLWSLSFFGLHLLWPAVGVIVLLSGLAYATFRATLRRDALAGWLVLPYVLWLSFATYLNVSIALLN